MRYGLTLMSLLAVNLFAGQGVLAEPSATLRDSWNTYVTRFVQGDGRVIDFKAGGITTSEGQAYAMLRAVWMGDRVTFDKTYNWGRNNLNSGIRNDHLWAWKWGKSPAGKWQVLDKAFATDADQDVALALILASRTWKEERYLKQARATLADLWNEGTLEVDGKRYLLGGDTLCQGHICRLNPSYYAPYAYRIFAAYDKSHNWPELVDSSYSLLERSSGLTQTHLPPDWVLLDRTTGRLSLSNEKDSAFSYDAFRVYWRIAMDRDLFGATRANEYLKTTLPWAIATWNKQGKLPAVISSRGKPLAKYESLEMLAALMPAMSGMEPEMATAISRQLQSAYHAGSWGDKDSYYLQNWGWFGTALQHRYLTPFQLAKDTGH